MEDFYEHQKQYCQPGESESHIGLAVAIACCFVAVPAWMLLLYALGF